MRSSAPREGASSGTWTSIGVPGFKERVLSRSVSGIARFVRGGGSRADPLGGRGPHEDEEDGDDREKRHPRAPPDPERVVRWGRHGGHNRRAQRDAADEDRIEEARDQARV